MEIWDKEKAILAIGCKASVQTAKFETVLPSEQRNETQGFSFMDGLWRKKLGFSFIFTFHIRFSEEKVGRTSHSQSRPQQP